MKVALLVFSLAGRWVATMGGEWAAVKADALAFRMVATTETLSRPNQIHPKFIMMRLA